MSLEDKMERTRRGEISECVFFTLGQSTPTQVLQVAARASALLPHSLCPTQLYKTHSYWQNVFSLKTSLYFLSKIPRKFTENVLNKNSLQKLTRVPKAVLFCGYATLGGTAHIGDGVPLYPTSDLL